MNNQFTITAVHWCIRCLFLDKLIKVLLSSKKCMEELAYATALVAAHSHEFVESINRLTNTT